jgi:hypothetical protein
MSDVFNVYARLECPKNNLLEFIDEELTLPDGIKELRHKKVNGKLKIDSIATEEVSSRYTPTTTINCGLETKRVVVKDGDVTHQTVGDYEKNAGWSDMVDPDEDYETVEVEYCNLYGYGDEVLVHSQLRREMFGVLCQFATPSVKGFVKGIILENGELQPTIIDAGGDPAPAEINIDRTDENTTDEKSDVNWTQTV